MARSVVNALFFLSLLALVGIAGLPRHALAHGGSHGEGRVAQSTTNSGAESRAIAQVDTGRVQQTRSLAHAAAPSHCPDGSFGACGCGHARLIQYTPALPGVHREALVITWPIARYRLRVGDSAPRPAFFLLAAPPRAPPPAPVTV